MDFVAQMNLSHGQDSISVSVTIVADAKDVFGDRNAPIPLPAGGTVNVSLSVDPDALDAYFIISTVNVTLTTTNDPAGTPDVVNVVANEPLFWHSKMQLPNGHFANRSPWTNLAFHNAGAVAGELQMLFARDGTP